MQHGLRRLPLEGLINARDLGGYPTKDGKMTRYGAAVRCEAPQSITDEDMKALKAYGIKTVVDLRGGEELERHPNRLDGAKSIEYHCCPAFDESVAIASKGKSPFKEDFDMADKYMEMVDKRKDWVHKVMTIIAASEGGVLFNCAMGKDRTGIIAALLLGHAGAFEADIIADYSVSDQYLNPLFERMWAGMREELGEETLEKVMPYFKTPPDNMRRLLAHIDAEYGGVTGYLRACGLDEDTLSRLRMHMVTE
jgi:protein-tyrosine phosphatase